MTGEVETCPVCRSHRTNSFLHRKEVVVHQNVVIADRSESQQFQRGELAMRCCLDCGFVYNGAFDPSLLSYGAEYDNRQTCSAVFETHVNELANDLADRLAVRNCVIVEVGCGDGGFIRKLVADEAACNTGYGFDPAHSGPESELGGRLRFVSRYFDKACTDIRADVVVCRHVIEHVPDPVALLGSVRCALGGRSGARVFFETPCSRWILSNQVIWDLFYEHCSLFSAASLATAFGLAGFVVDDVRRVFGGQYLWLEGHVADGTRGQTHSDAGDIPELAEAFSQIERQRVAKWSDWLSETARQCPIALWGAAAKGTTFASLVDPDCTYIDCMVDVNPNKQGRFLAGTGHPIVGPDALREREIGCVLILNPNYRVEIERTISDAGLDIPVVDMMASRE